MESAMKIAVILSAYDKMSSVINSATDNAQKKFRDMTSKFAEGGVLMATGVKLAKTLEPMVDAFKDAQEAGNDLKASMMTKGGVLDEDMYKKIYSLSNDLSDKYKGSMSSYLEMVTVLKNNRINESDVLGGIGESTAKLSDFFKMAPASIAEFAAHMKNDMGVGVGEMDKMMDMIARVHNSGVGKTGSEAVTEMNEFFSKASLGATNLGVQGLEASKQMGALGALFMSRGLSGATVGTNFRRIFDGLRDVDKVHKANEAARQYGITLELFDKQGHFKGMDSFVQQMGKMQSLSPQAIQSIFKAFGGKQGLSTDFLEYLGKEGLKGFSEFNKKIDEQATLDQKLKAIMDGLAYKQGVMNTSWTNLKATMGAALNPVLTKFYDTMNSIITSVRKFLDENPRLKTFIVSFIALASAGMMLAGIIRVIQGIRIAVALLGITMNALPFFAIATAAILVVSLIITYWDKIGPWFKWLWDKVKNIFSTAWKWIKNMLLNYTPQGLIIQHWAKITAWFSDLWEQTKAVFSVAWEKMKEIVIAPITYIKEKWDALKNWFKKLWDDISGFAKNAWSWIKDKASFTTPQAEMVKMMKAQNPQLQAEMAKSMQIIDDHLPHSPAKRGPLSRLHKVRIIETIAEGMKPHLLANKMHLALSSVANSGISSGRSTGSPIHFHFTLNGSATKQDAKTIADELEKRFPQLMKKYNGQQSRVAFG